MRFLGAVRVLLATAGVVCALAGAATGEVYSARARTRSVRGPSQRATRPAIQDSDHSYEWESGRLGRLILRSSSPDVQPPAEAPAPVAVAPLPRIATFELPAAQRLPLAAPRHVAPARGPPSLL